MTAAPTTSSLSFNTLTGKPRIATIDIIRGLVMIVMALDHTRDFYHADVAVFDPTDLTKTNPALFFTRWITHFCAPTFVFLSGMSAYISRQRKSTKELSLFLFTRGLWLIVLEFTIVRLGITFNLYYDFVIFQVIWVIGASMIVLSALVFFSQKAILSIGLALVLGHNLFDLIQLQPPDNGYVIWSIIQQAGSASFGPGNFTQIAYPLIPWLGIMLTGYGMGVLFDKDVDPARRKKILLTAGLMAMALFVVIRFTNLYGDPRIWSVQKNALFTIMSFLNVTKYPVSLLYTLMTLGPVLVIMAWMENWKTDFLEPARIIGRVPLFYYILHFYLIHFTALCVLMISTGISWSDINFQFPTTFGGIPPGVGHSLGWVYLAWICIVIALYPLCKWYHHYKSTHHQWWLGYL
ncbi:MAG TPA: heparan-alpha-glucosaminide N-acetyltransferase domain-containing protein [Chryseolinea sp.]